MGSVRIGDELCKCDQRVIDAFDGRIRELEEERDQWQATAEGYEIRAIEAGELHVSVLTKERDIARAESAQWQESCGQNYVRAQEAEAREEGLREAVRDGIRILRNDPHDPDRLTESDELNHRAESLLRKALENTDGQ